MEIEAREISGPLENRFIKTRKQSLLLCESLEVEDFVVQPLPEVSPPKWHLAHTTWFLEELLLNKFQPPYKFHNESYRKLFNSYYKTLGEHWPQSNRGQLSRPTVLEIYKYRQTVEDEIINLAVLNRWNNEFHDMFELAVNHEEQHQELLLMDIKVILGSNPQLPAYKQKLRPTVQSGKPEWKFFEEGVYQIGTSEKNSFHFDNESPRHKVYLQSFHICNKLITNGEYLNFINDGGYRNALLWKSIGHDWIRSNNIKKPYYWNKDLSAPAEYTLYGENDLDLNAPVSHISYFEADAFARWMGMRLPTEQEFEVASESMPLVQREFIFHPSDCGAFNSQLWVWTQSQYSPYPGYRAYAGELNEYNGKFMCNQFVLKGGCIATPKRHYKRTYRNFFEPQQRWMFSGICLAKDDL
ncbi:MAG: ergothioneine biosynthesis protein EgtB [Bacteriovorax sp.]|jgi:ergothioneine biosynthesis protein EgtB